MPSWARCAQASIVWRRCERKNHVLGIPSAVQGKGFGGMRGVRRPAGPRPSACVHMCSTAFRSVFNMERRDPCKRGALGIEALILIPANGLRTKCGQRGRGGEGEHGVLHRAARRGAGRQTASGGAEMPEIGDGEVTDSAAQPLETSSAIPRTHGGGTCGGTCARHTTLHGMQKIK